MMGYELENGSQIGNLVQLNLTVSSTAQTPLSKIDLPLPPKGIYQHPLNTGHITPLPSNPIKSPFPRCYNPNKKCEHHDGILNHLIKSCKNFRYQVWKLKSKGQVEFVKDNVINHIVTRSSWVQQVVGKYWQDTNVYGEFDPMKSVICVKLSYSAFWFGDCITSFN